MNKQLIKLIHTSAAQRHGTMTDTSITYRSIYILCI